MAQKIGRIEEAYEAIPPGPPRTRAASVFTRLRDDIAECRLLPGRRLRLDELSQMYDAGYTPIREALSRLAAEGLVVLEEHKGYRISSISREDWLDILMMRRELESLGLALSMAQAGDAWRQSVIDAAAALDSLEPQFRDEPIKSEWHKQHRAFHRSLISACGSPWLLKFSDKLIEQSHRYLKIGLMSRLFTEPDDHVNEHRAIVRAIEEGDPTLASALLKNHLSHTTRLILSAPNEQFPDWSAPSSHARSA